MKRILTKMERGETFESEIRTRASNLISDFCFNFHFRLGPKTSDASFCYPLSHFLSLTLTLPLHLTYSLSSYLCVTNFTCLFLYLTVIIRSSLSVQIFLILHFLNVLLFFFLALQFLNVILCFLISFLFKEILFSFCPPSIASFALLFSLFLSLLCFFHSPPNFFF